jgi:hypothetical protein
MNFCLVKYIHLKDVKPSVLHTTEDYELSSAVIGHSSYEEMETNVMQNCPEGFVCFDPITLHHEVLWKTSLKAGANGLVEVDQLFRPIDMYDYANIRWGASHADARAVSVCVHIEPREIILG